MLGGSEVRVLLEKIFEVGVVDDIGGVDGELLEEVLQRGVLKKMRVSRPKRCDWLTRRDLMGLRFQPPFISRLGMPDGPLLGVPADVLRHGLWARHF